MSRPEDTLSADVHYDDTEARKYTTSSRIQNIQASMTHRALELLDLPSPSLILDVGCGSGLSGEILSSLSPEEGGPHVWIGMDVSASMLDVALQRDVEGDLLLADIGQECPSAPEHSMPPSASARSNGCAMPRNNEQKKMITGAAVKAGFGAGLLEDDPDTKNAKLYLVLTVGAAVVDGKSGDITGVVQGMEGVDVMDARNRGKAGSGEIKKGSKAWIVKKKEQMERKGKVVKATSKYTGRKRRVAF
ncbi:hypothetical protein PG994_011344 [Apiospora phragmitis]|uniref:18S rRNA (guanine(1575)-N(7))-methyltransferase Bud23 C-terminal domain-containing protein n=1 Tax=Apiospora phragmitis TaxID=2905665 RepID=A0ABR1TSM4_9PEZI